MLKNVLSLLLSKFYSKQESELVGHQAMPSSSVVRLTPKLRLLMDGILFSMELLQRTALHA